MTFKHIQQHSRSRVQVSSSLPLKGPAELAEPLRAAQLECRLLCRPEWSEGQGPEADFAGVARLLH